MATAVRLLSPAGLLALLVSATVAAPKRVEEPVIDGDLSDLLVFAESLNLDRSGCGLEIEDSERDVAVLDPEFSPCSALDGHYFVNGFDIVRVIVAMRGGDLFLGLRAAGMTGDADGDGNPDGVCGATGILDEPGIGPDDCYTWALDTNCSTQFTPDVTVSIRGNSLHAVGMAYDTAAYTFRGADLEVKLTNARLTSGASMNGLAARAAANSNSDGLSEDSSPVLWGPPISPAVRLSADARPRKIHRGEDLTVGIVVHNPGMARLERVQLRDALPAGFAYVPGSAWGIGEPTVMGSGELCFPDVALNAGEEKPIRFRMSAGPQSSGEVSNLARVVARSTNDCYPPPGFLEVLDSAETGVTCLPAPGHK